MLGIRKRSGALPFERITLGNVTGIQSLVSNVERWVIGLKIVLRTMIKGLDLIARMLKLEHETLSEPLRVATRASKTIETHKVYGNCKISISKQNFEAELIQLNMIEFDINLGMDWLTKHHAMVECQKKKVKLQTPSQKEIIYHGEFKERKSLLFASQTWKAIKCGEEIYLAMINEVKGEDAQKLKDIPIVQEFPDVFPEDLPGGIPDREVEFEINLVPGAASI
ncbi:uncharacterized protein LOC142538714 [Primulina tabacum]|uniref:uncharacterized protein LOC142538714 n=1 Tax=Primulina tabacum TaxID=48773 RepID=UPI003F594EFA